MIGLDTNVLVRYFVQDDEAQAAAATAFVENLTAEEPGYLSVVTVVELYWVLRRSYSVDAATVIGLLLGVLETREFVVGESGLLRTALHRAAAGADLADALIVELDRRAGCTDTMTFDRAAVGHAGMRLLNANQPN